MKSRTAQSLIRRRLLAWFSTNRRDLPWRHTTDPYAIAISEVMLQQTQVDRVIPKYQDWLNAFPTVKSLAQAPLSKVLRLWSGLGYNSRGVRLRQMARDIQEQHRGKFPQTVQALESLPGIGSYTARAIASFSFRQDEAVIDTNVRRVINRIFFGVQGAKSPKELQKTVNQILPAGRSHQWNAALMDIGALVCQSRRPKCETCPVQQYCRAYPDVLTETRSVRKKVVPFKKTDRYWRGRIVVILVHQGPQTLPQLHQRLKKLGEISRQRVSTLAEALQQHKIVRRSGGVIQIQA